MTAGASTPGGNRPPLLRWAALGLVAVIFIAVVAAPTEMLSMFASGPQAASTPTLAPSIPTVAGQVVVLPNGGSPPSDPNATVVVVLPGETPQPTPVLHFTSELETTYDQAVVWIGLRDGSVRRVEVKRPGTSTDPNASSDQKPAGITPVVTMTSYGADNVVTLEMIQSTVETWTWETTPYVGENQDYELGKLRVSLRGDTAVNVQVTEGILVTEEDYRADRLPTHN